VIKASDLVEFTDTLSKKKAVIERDLGVQVQRDVRDKPVATSPRFLQLTAVFPVLAVAILRGGRNLDRLQALHLVEIGAPLRRIADLMDVPMVLRKVKPGVAHWAFGMEETLAQNPGLIDAYMPQSLPRMRVWLKAVRFALSVSSDFGEFIAKHATEVGATAVEASIWIEDAADWVRACLPAPGPPPRPGTEFITRRFSPDMSVKTVTALTHEWHEAVANNMTGPSYEFPEPWAQPGKMGDYEIMPITNSGDLCREGNAMHHCAGTYGESVREGRCYIYSLRKDGARLATVELVQFEGQVNLGQIRGSC
jgi:PcfJ-like protein